MRLISFIFIICFVFNITVSAQTEESAQGFFTQGMQAANAGDYQAALEFYKKSQSENSSQKNLFLAKIHYNNGVCFYQLNRYVEAVESFTKALSLNKNYPKAFYGLGMAETELKDFAEAENAFLESIKLNSQDGEAWFDLAMVLVQKKDYKNAQKAFIKANKYNSISKSASYNNLGVIFALSHNFSAAEKQFKLALLESDGKLTEAENNLQLCRLHLQAQDTKLLSKLEFSIKNNKNL